MVRNTYLELSDYIEYMHSYVDHIENKALREQGDGYISFLDEINAKQGLIYVKEFYIVVPYYPLENDVENIHKPWWRKFLDALSSVDTPEKIVSRYRSFLANNKFLDTRVQVVLE
ncbi:MAG: hypothetical protein H6765_06360 [Candidatus Peribacteria bacterium]|nr:MAG: hypothetical protein H6765_06360 [Candidatus Peribacteria bacterium]